MQSMITNDEIKIINQYGKYEYENTGQLPSMKPTSMINRLEVEEEKKFYEWTKKEDITCIKLNLQGRRGWPDRLVMTNYPNIIFIEFKRKGGETRKLQEFIHKSILDQGWKVFTVESAEDAKALCRRYLL